MQRFAVLRTVLLDPVFLFADEATSRLDPVSQKEVLELMVEIVRETGLGPLLVTHDRVLWFDHPARPSGSSGGVRPWHRWHGLP